LPVVHIFQFCFVHPKEETINYGGYFMKDEVKETSDGLNQLFEVINAKGDIGELKNIVDGKEVKEDSTKNHQAYEDLT
jgi:hypothetical protein